MSSKKENVFRKKYGGRQIVLLKNMKDGEHQKLFGVLRGRVGSQLMVDEGYGLCTPVVVGAKEGCFVPLYIGNGPMPVPTIIAPQPKMAEVHCEEDFDLPYSEEDLEYDIGEEDSERAAIRAESSEFLDPEFDGDGVFNRDFLIGEIRRYQQTGRLFSFEMVNED